MPQARRLTNPTTPDQKDEFRQRVRDALDRADSFDEFRDYMDESDPDLPGLTIEEVRAMTPSQINSNWKAVQRVVSERGAPPNETPHTAETQLLSMDVLRRMSPAEHLARRAEIDQFLSTGRGQS